MLYGVSHADLGIFGAIPISLIINGHELSLIMLKVFLEFLLSSFICDHIDALYADCNTAAAIGKRFAIGLATLVGLFLFGEFVRHAKRKAVDIFNLLNSEDNSVST